MSSKKTFVNKLPIKRQPTPAQIAWEKAKKDRDIQENNKDKKNEKKK